MEKYSRGYGTWEEGPGSNAAHWGEEFPWTEVDGEALQSAASPDPSDHWRGWPAAGPAPVSSDERAEATPAPGAKVAGWVEGSVGPAVGTYPSRRTRTMTPAIEKVVRREKDGGTLGRGTQEGRELP
ncbi:MAG: hypothetical protein ACLPZM_02490 [Thermoplasmata archaeon]